MVIFHSYVKLPEGIMGFDSPHEWFSTAQAPLQSSWQTQVATEVVVDQFII